MRALKQMHVFFGLAGLIAVALEGQYMHWLLNHLHGMPDGPRLLYRSAHLYLFWSAAVNLMLGIYLAKAASVLGRRLQIIGSCAILSGPVLLCVAFFVEPGLVGLSRPWARLAIYLAVTGVACHGFSEMLVARSKRM